MAYLKSIWESNNKRFRIEKKYYSQRALPLRPEIREKRAKRQNVTKQTQLEVNRRLRAEKLSRLLVDNFEAGDWYLTCTFREVPDTETIQKELEKFKRRIRAIYQKTGMSARYISVLENLTGSGRPHGHILLPALGKSELEKIKKAWPHGNVEVKLYGGHLRDAERLADYFTKEKVAAHSGRIQVSRNLLRTVPKKTKVTRSEAYKTEIDPPKGYRLLKDLSYSTYTAEGYPLTIAYFEKIETGRGHGQKNLQPHRSNALCGDTHGAPTKTIRSGRRKKSDGADGDPKC